MIVSELGMKVFTVICISGNWIFFKGRVIEQKRWLGKLGKVKETRVLHRQVCWFCFAFCLFFVVVGFWWGFFWGGVAVV